MTGRIPEEETPKVIASIAQYYLTERGQEESFPDFVARVGADTVSKVGLAVAPGACRRNALTTRSGRCAVERAICAGIGK